MISSPDGLTGSLSGKIRLVKHDVVDVNVAVIIDVNALSRQGNDPLHEYSVIIIKRNDISGAGFTV